MQIAMSPWLVSAVCNRYHSCVSEERKLSLLN